MRFLIPFFLGTFLVGGDNAIPDGTPAVDVGSFSEDKTPDSPHQDQQEPNGLCTTIGREFCGDVRCEFAHKTKDTFKCNCGSDFYFDATDKSCKHLQSCLAKPCVIGSCIQNNPQLKGKCDCSASPWNKDVNVNCEIQQSKHEECKKLGAKARILDDIRGVVCDCGLGMVLKNNKCQATTCVNHSMSCRDLCENHLLDKDNLCCEGWDAKKCSEPPAGDTYCPPGTVREDGKCVDACTAKLGDLVCPNGCKQTPEGPKPFICKCKDGEELGEDGLTCKRKVRCNKEEKAQCQPGQECFFDGTTAFCDWKKCTTAKNCHRLIATCKRHLKEDECFCDFPLTLHGQTKDFCNLDYFSYILTFKTNDTTYHDADSCHGKSWDIRKAMKTLYGPDLLETELNKCSADAVELRLIFESKQDPAVLKTINFCRFLENGNCFIAPNFYVKKNSVIAPVEEDLCKGVLKNMLNFPGGPQVCEKKEDGYTLKCLADKEAHSEVKAGRVTRWLCNDTKSTADDADVTGITNSDKTTPAPKSQEIEDQKSTAHNAGVTGITDSDKTTPAPKSQEIEDQKSTAHDAGVTGVTDSDKTTPAPKSQEIEDPCKTIGETFCGQETCKTFDNNASFTCDCAINFYFDATDKKCKELAEKSKCTSEDIVKCKSKNKMCIIQNNNPTCECPVDTVRDSEGCSGNCTDDVIKECSSGFTKCVVEDHKQICACGPFLRWDRKLLKCVLDETYWYRVSFKLHERSKRSTDSVVGCEDSRFEVENSLKVLYGNELLKTKILQCTDAYEVEMTFSKKQHPAVLQRIRRCEHSNTENSCFFPPSLYIEKESVSNVTQEDICTLDPDVLASKFGDGLECRKDGEMQYSLKCSERYKRVMNFTVGKLQVDVCTKKPCAEYCKQPNRECDGENCVCQRDHIPEGDDCVSSCSKNPCRNGGTCISNKHTSFYCRCTSGFVGPTCTEKNEELAATTKNMTIVGAVLGALIVLCLGVAFVIVRRLQNEAAAAQNDSEVSQAFADDSK